MSFQFGLVEALDKARAWVLTNEQITELENLTLGLEQDNMKHWHWPLPMDLNINFLFDERLQAINHQYSAPDTASLTANWRSIPVESHLGNDVWTFRAIGAAAAGDQTTWRRIMAL